MYLISAADGETAVTEYSTFDEAFLAMMDGYVKAIRVSERWELRETDAIAEGKITYRWKIVRKKPVETKVTDKGIEVTYESED